jgi:hypothetical protein
VDFPLTIRKLRRLYGRDERQVERIAAKSGKNQECHECDSQNA